MRKLLATTAITMTLALTTCGVNANAVTITGEPIQESSQESFIDFLIEAKEAEQDELRTEIMQSRIQSLNYYVGKTWYVFSGITPDGWDCSGLVMWFYSKFGVELEHSVTAQIHSGRIVDDPKPGDIVAFKHNGSSFGYHNGIYIGNDLFMHSPRKGRTTSVESVSEYAGQHSEVVYTRVYLSVLE
jgi:cell wall-associated NlpC family hydrolase